jgi:hypothetical protein
VLALDFFRDPEDWTQRRPDLTPVLQQVRGRVGKEIAHLTYARQEVTAERKRWFFGRIALDLCSIFNQFFTLIPRHLLGQRWQTGNPCESDWHQEPDRNRLETQSRTTTGPAKISSVHAQQAPRGGKKKKPGHGPGSMRGA